MSNRFRSFVSVCLLLCVFCIARCAVIRAENLALHAQVDSHGFIGNASHIVDDTLLEETSEWDSPGTIRSETSSATVTINLGRPQPIRFLVLQGDWNESYIVESGTEVDKLVELWRAPKANFTPGIRTRVFALQVPIVVQFLKIKNGNDGDGILSLSEIQVFASRPPLWEQLKKRAEALYPPYTLFSGLTVKRIEVIKTYTAGVAFACALVLIMLLPLETVAVRQIRIATKGLIVAGLIGAAAWSNFFQFHFESFVHRHEFFHYYIGSKYYRELSYTRLYECGYVADREDNFESGPRTMRNLISNESILYQPTFDTSQCKKHFSSGRWSAFKADLSWFRSNMNRKDYLKMFTDHGFNATPVWTTVGHFISNLGALSTYTINAIGTLDITLMTITWIVVLRTFGVIPGCIGLVCWGVSFIACFAWTGNAFLRSDWLAATLLGICALKKDKHFLSGALLCYAGLARIFPFAFLGMLVLRAIIDTVSGKHRELRHQRIVLLKGAGTCLLVCSLLSFLVAGNLGQYQDFVHNTAKHFATRSTNMMGLKPLTNFSTKDLFDDTNTGQEQSAVDQAKAMLQQQSTRQTIYIVVSLVFLFGTLVAALSLKDYEVVSLGAVIPFLISLSNYDYYFLLPLIFFWGSRSLIPLGLLAVTWLSWVGPMISGAQPVQYGYCSLLVGTFLGASLIHIIRSYYRHTDTHVVGTATQV